MSDNKDKQPDVGVVYVVTNPAMPGLVKIGSTKRDDVSLRIGELYTQGGAGVPLPFDCVYAVKVANYREVEKGLHSAFPRLNLGENSLRLNLIR